MMPRKQPCSDETDSPTSSSKNVKDKNKSTAMQASHQSADESNRSSSSEKDSGFSDTSSECKNTNAKDRSNQKSRETEFTLSQTSEANESSSHENTVVAPSTPQLPSSFYIIKNMVLEQPHIVQKNGQLLWSSGAGPNIPGSNPVLLLQPPNVLPPAIHPQAPGVCESDAAESTDATPHLPVPKTYPRIAPHPNKKPPDKTAPPAESANQSKRVCTESNVTHTGNPQEQHIHQICASSSATSSSSATLSTTQLTSSVANTRHRRFVNTVQALKQSGLLDIALRTKELMCQSSVTGRDVAQLRRHSDVLCQVAGASDQNPSNMAAWLNLHRVMADSGSYPGLKDEQALRATTVGENVCVVKTESVEEEGDSDGAPGASSNAEASPEQIRDDKSETAVEQDTSADSLMNE